MLLASKQPYEEYFITVTFGDFVDTSETVASYTITVADEAGGDVTSTILDTTKTVNNGTSLSLWVRGGTSDNAYTILFKVTGSDGQKVEKELVLPVLDTE